MHWESLQAGRPEGQGGATVVTARASQEQGIRGFFSLDVIFVFVFPE